MNLNRRDFLTAGAGVATLASAGGAPPPKTSDFESIRNEFPRATEQVYLDAAANTPLPKYTAEGMRKYMDFHMYGPGEGRGAYADGSLPTNSLTTHGSIQPCLQMRLDGGSHPI